MLEQYRFSRLLNPDWSIQISGAPAVCKETGDRNLLFVTFLDTYLLDVVKRKKTKNKKTKVTLSVQANAIGYRSKHLNGITAELKFQGSCAVPSLTLLVNRKNICR